MWFDRHPDYATYTIFHRQFTHHWKRFQSRIDTITILFWEWKRSHAAEITRNLTGVNSCATGDFSAVSATFRLRLFQMVC